MNCTVCIVSPEQEKQYQFAVTTWKKHLPDWEHIKVNIESDMVQGLKEDYKQCDQSQFLSAIRPAVVEQFLEQYEKVLFLSPEIVLFSAPEEFIGNDYSEAIVVPHVISGVPQEDLADIVQNGHLDSNIVLWTDSNKIKNFLKWQSSVLKNFTMTEQLTLNCLPYFVDDVKILRDPGYNFSSFNINERGVKVQDGKWFTNGWQPLVCMQFSGFDGKELKDDVLTLVQWYNEELNKDE